MHWRRKWQPTPVFLPGESQGNIENRAYDYTSGVYYIDLIAELEKIGDFIINISEAAVQMR